MRSKITNCTAARRYLKIKLLEVSSSVELPHSRMLSNYLSIRDLSCRPKEVSQRLTISVREVSADGVSITGVGSLSSITIFHPDRSSLCNENKVSAHQILRKRQGLLHMKAL